ncbi:MAG TPA: cytochrome c [Bryobacteraceae bacterium]|nr:cytochrome c [Bryobacteraceae bacterium]
MLKTKIALASAIGVLFAASAFAQKDPKDIYLDKCSVCHGADGAGKTAKGRKLKVKDVHETVGKVSADEMIKIVTDGKGSDMDAFGKELGAAQIKAIVDYYRSLGK